MPDTDSILHLPADLVAAIEDAIAAVPAARWMRAAQAVSERYRGPRGAQALASGPDDALGYAALVLPATYAQLRGAFAATAARIPSWAPEALLDIGSGPGTALWAAAAQWPSLRTLVAWEREQAFIDLGRRLAQKCEMPLVQSARWVRTDLRSSRDIPEQNFDIVVLGHVLNELEPPVRARVVAEAWARTAGVLLIAEPGTPEAFAVVREARDSLLQAGAQTLAPCAHNRPCPLENDWCHFPQRLWRPDFQRRARGAPSQWEEAKFAYAAMARFSAEMPIWGRVIREPTFNKAYSEMLVSSKKGVVRYRAFKRYREEFKQVKNTAWGAPLMQQPDEPIAPVDE